MLFNRSIPDAAVIPVLAYPDLDAAIAWLTSTFGFRVRLRIGNHRAQMIAGQGAFVVAAREQVEPPLDSLLIRITNLDGHYEHSRSRGARILSEPGNYPYGERQYTVEDLIGRRWTFSETIADVDPREWGGEAVEL
jgi:uncharacterized glyoxalase superfamily protein PhnB